jgi:hypothetical protein
MKSAQDNKKLWRALERTDPKFTKEVGFGRKFTSINPQWQIMRMTEVFGPVGEGWSYEVEHDVLVISDKLILCFADVTVAWRMLPTDLGHNTYGPVRGCTELYYEGKGGRMMVDDDAPKKAMTDALTKALSHIGVSADIFLGMWEDNKYVQRMTREWAAEKIADGPLPGGVTAALEQLRDIETVAELDRVIATIRSAAGDWDQIHRDLYAIRARERKLQLGGTVPAE